LHKAVRWTVLDGTDGVGEGGRLK